MQPRSDEVLPALDISVGDMPPRSHLFALPPVGLGTDRVEGLISYITRLARAHSVRPRSLIRCEFVKACRSPEQLRCSARHSRDVRTMDGLGRYAEIFGALTTELTTVPAVRHLTLLPLANLLPPTSAGLIASQLRWCPDCFAEMIAQGQDVWRPLLWSLDLYRICHRHRRPLDTHCGTCGKIQPFLPLLPELDRCPYCRASLSGGNPEHSDLGSAEAQPDVDMSIAQLLADMVANLPELDGIATLERFREFLRAAIEDVSGGNRVRFCELVGLRRWAVKNWLTRNERPSLPQLVSLALGTGASIPAMFQIESTCSVPCISNKPATTRDRARRTGMTEGERRVLASKLAEIANDPGRTNSAAEVARSLNLTTSSLRYWFPEAYATICFRHAEATKTAAKLRRERRYRVIGEVVRAIAARGEYPGRRKVNEALARHHLSLAQQDMKDAYRKALRKHIGLMAS